MKKFPFKIPLAIFIVIIFSFNLPAQEVLFNNADLSPQNSNIKRDGVLNLAILVTQGNVKISQFQITDWKQTMAS